MLSFLNVVLCVLVLSITSKDGSLIDSFQSYKASSGIVVDQLMPFYTSLDTDTNAYFYSYIVPEGEYLINITFTSELSKDIRG